MKTYLKLTVTTHGGAILTMACTPGNAAVIAILATNNKSVLVEETIIHKDLYDTLILQTVSKMCE